MKRLIVFILAGALLLTGCGAPVSSSGVQAQCGSSGLSGSCDVTIGSLSGGKYTYEVKNANFSDSNRPAEVTISVTAESGELTVWVENGNDRTAVNVAAGQTAKMTGTAAVLGAGDNRYFRVFFEPHGEGDAKRAEGISAYMEYSVP